MSEQFSDVEKAQALVAEWNNGKGTSKKDIELREWHDATSHGRRFDRFIQATLGINTSPVRSRPPTRIQQLEAQVRSLGSTPVGAPDWEHDLQSSRHAVLAGLRSLNDPALNQALIAFATSVLEAWTLYCCAYLKRRGDEWRWHDERGRLVKVDGHEVPAPLSELLTRTFPDLAFAGLRANVELWRALRPKLSGSAGEFASLTPYVYAAVRNFELNITTDFSDDFSLGTNLVVPISLFATTDQRLADEAATALTGDDRFTNAELAHDPTFFLPLALQPPTTTKLAPNLSAADVVALVSQCIPFRFTVPAHNAVTNALKVRTSSRSTEATRATDRRYCEWSSANKRHVYNQRWVERLIHELSNAKRFEELTGFKARIKQQPADVVPFDARQPDTVSPISLEDLTEFDIAF
jgi:hypothetical protein